MAIWVLPVPVWYLQADLAGLRLKRPSVVTRPRILAALAALVSACAAQPVRFRIQHRIQRLLDRATNHLAKVVANARLVDLNDLSHPFGLLVLVHSQLLSESLIGTAVKSKCAKDSVRYRLQARRCEMP